MRYLPIPLIIACHLLICSLCLGQNKQIDSLKILVKNSSGIEEKIEQTYQLLELLKDAMLIPASCWPKKTWIWQRKMIFSN